MSGKEKSRERHAIDALDVGAEFAVEVRLHLAKQTQNRLSGMAKLAANRLHRRYQTRLERTSMRARITVRRVE